MVINTLFLILTQTTSPFPCPSDGFFIKQSIKIFIYASYHKIGIDRNINLNLTQTFGQRYHDHTVYFDNMDGFTGYVKFKTLYGVSWPPQVTANSGAMVMTGYDATEEEITALNKGGLDLRR